MKILDEYEAWGLCSEVKKVMGVWQYDDSELERLSTIMTLHDVGFTNLDEIHFKEMQIRFLNRNFAGRSIYRR